MCNEIRVELSEIQDHPSVSSYETKKYYDEDIGFTTIKHTFVIDGVEFTGVEPSYLDYIEIVKWNDNEMDKIKNILKQNDIPFEIV